MLDKINAEHALLSSFHSLLHPISSSSTSLLWVFQGDQLHFEKDTMNRMLRKIVFFLLYYFFTQNLRILYKADSTLCLRNAAAIPVFPYSPVSPFLSEPVCRLLWAAGAARARVCRMKHLGVQPPGRTQRSQQNNPGQDKSEKGIKEKGNRNRKQSLILELTQ